MDPISLDVTKPTTLPYNDTELTPTSFYNYIVRNIPDFTNRVENDQALIDFRDIWNHIDINKVVILSNRHQITPEFKAISCAFKERLVFAYVPFGTQLDTKEFEGVTRSPEIVILKSYDPETNTTLKVG